VRDDSVRLNDILEAIENIQRKLPLGKDAFFQDEMLQVWFIHHIQIMGEAASRLSPEYREVQSDLPWSDIVSMRNVLVH
jgi:uncharacterized protein with HEPN domain